MAARFVAAEFLQDLLRLGDHQYPAVLRIGDGDRAVAEQVGVVGLVQVARFRAGHAGVAVGPEQLAAGIGELDDALVLLLVGDDPGAAVDEEGVVGEVEPARRRRVRARGEAPEDVLLGVDDEQPVVAAVGDHHLPGKGRGRRGGGFGRLGDRLVRHFELDHRRQGRFAGTGAADQVGGGAGHGGAAVGDRLGQLAGGGDALGPRFEAPDLRQRRAAGFPAEDVDAAAERHGACVGERLRQPADDPGLSRLRVDLLDRVTGGAARRLAAEGVDAPAECGDRQVASRRRQPRDLGEARPVARRQDRVERLAAVVATKDVGGLADGHGAEIGAHAGQLPGRFGTGSGRNDSARRRERLDRVGARFRAAAEDKHAFAEQRRGGVVQRARQRSRFAQLAADGVQLEDTAGGVARGIEAAEDQRAFLRRDDGLSGDRCGQGMSETGDEHCPSGGCRSGLGRTAPTRAAADRNRDDDERDDPGQEDETPPSRPRRGRAPPPRSVHVATITAPA